MIQRMDFIACLVAVVLILSVIGCSDDDSTTSPAADIREGWNHFSNGEYAEGESRFGQVLSSSPSHEEAYLGRGWCRLMQLDLTGSVDDLGELPESSSLFSDAQMGLAAANFEQQGFDSAIANASEVLASDSLYEFSHATRINYLDARLIRAQCYYRLGETYYPSAHDDVVYMCDKTGIEQISQFETPISASYELELSRKLEELAKVIAD